MSGIGLGGPFMKSANLQMGNKAWFEKFAWVTTRDFMYWHRGQESFNEYINADIYAAGKFLLGENYRYCDITCIPAELADKTEISYKDEDFLLLLLEYYSEENITPFDNVNMVYELHPSVSKLEQQKNPKKFQVELLALINKTTHITGKSFLITMLSDYYFGEGSWKKAVELLKSIPHERRRSYAFLKLFYACNKNTYCGQQLDKYFTYMMHPVDKRIALGDR